MSDYSTYRPHTRRLKISRNTTTRMFFCSFERPPYFSSPHSLNKVMKARKMYKREWFPLQRWFHNRLKENNGKILQNEVKSRSRLPKNEKIDTLCVIKLLCTYGWVFSFDFYLAKFLEMICES